MIIQNKKIKFLLFLIFGLLATLANGQMTNSPYSVFGPGEIQNQGFILNSGMGGAGISLKSGNCLNRLNPASYNGIDSLRVISEIGAEGKFTQRSTYRISDNSITGSLKYLALGLRYNRWMAGAFGISPFSSVGYNITKQNKVEGLNSTYYSNYVGSGGITQFYWGNSIKFLKNLSVGANISYMFGSLTQTENILASDVVPQFQIVRQDHLKSFYYDFGMQYYFRLKNTDLSLGATFSPKQNLKSKHYIVVSDESYSTLHSDEYNTDYLAVPVSVGTGIGIEKEGKYTFAFDYTFQKWSDVEYPTQVDDFADSHQISLGIEVAPWEHRIVNKAFKNWDYRLGFNYKSSYLKIDENIIDDKSLSLGLGIPLPNRVSKMNVAFILGSRGTCSHNLIRENYAMFQFGFSLNEIWFVRRKYD
ncbi:MAG: hypothetical protein JXR31_16215 [Prolixibacteraceae bacterium]|nr:hypothetical protein [Prolixibacteraceae bacterium]